MCKVFVYSGWCTSTNLVKQSPTSSTAELYNVPVIKQPVPEESIKPVVLDPHDWSCGLAFFYLEDKNNVMFENTANNISGNLMDQIPDGNEAERSQALYFQLKAKLAQEKGLSVQLYSTPGFNKKITAVKM